MKFHLKFATVIITLINLCNSYTFDALLDKVSKTSCVSSLG